MAARGPDGKGEWVSDDGRVGFGHRRLSIIDLSDAGAQPMASADGTLVVTFNGEIYNYRELRRGLEAKGHVFRSQSDTEVLLHLYAEKGEAMVHELRGMFAFAIWDAERRALFLARDPYGIKPLYYADDGWTFRFASQVKALLAGGAVSRDPEPAGHGRLLPVRQRARAVHDLPRDPRAAGRQRRSCVDRHRRARAPALSFDRAGLLRRRAAPRAAASTQAEVQPRSARRSSTACAIISSPTCRSARSSRPASTPARWSA